MIRKNLMKTYKHLFDEMVKTENLTECFFAAAKRKTLRNDVARVLKPERDAGNTSEEPDCLQEHVAYIQRQLIEETWKPYKHKPIKINEHSCGKVRDIIRPSYKYEQVVHHCIIKQLQPIVMHGLYEHALGSIPTRGTHSGKKQFEKWIRKYRGKKLYVLKADIRHCFETEDIKVLERKLAKIIKDEAFLNLCCLVMESEAHWEEIDFLPDGGLFDFEDTTEEILCGLPLGFVTSQWMMQLNFKEFDHKMKEDWGAGEYMRYADDIVVLGTNKRKLHQLRQKVGDYLNIEMHQKLKYNWQVFRFEHPVGKKVKGEKQKTKGRAVDFMGFVFHYNRTTLRKTILYRSRRKAHRLEKKEKVTWYDASAMLSYMGWYDDTDTYDYFREYIKPCVDVKKLKKIVSKHSRKEQKQHDKLVQSTGNGGPDGIRHDFQPNDRLSEKGNQAGDSTCDGRRKGTDCIRVQGTSDDAGGVQPASGRT